MLYKGSGNPGGEIVDVLDDDIVFLSVGGQVTEELVLVMIVDKGVVVTR